jgi:MATE family multidrug resistance protein
MIYRRILTLAVPMIAALLAQVGLEVIDTFMLGQLGYKALASGGLATTIYVVFIVLSVGLLSAVGVNLSKHRDNPEVMSEFIVAGLQLGLVLIPFAFVFAWSSTSILLACGQDPKVMQGYAEFMHYIVFGYPAVLIFLLVREYLAAIERTQALMWISTLAIPTNLCLNYLFMYGIGPIPPMGIKGVALATVCIEWLGAVILVYIIATRMPLPLKIKHQFYYDKIWQLLKLGAPFAMTMLLEIILFSVAGVMAGYLGVKALAVHQIALQLTTVLVMVPYGFSQAAGILLAQSTATEHARWIRAFIILVLMSVVFSIWLLLTYPAALVSLFIHEQIEPHLLTHGIALLKIAALYQFADSLQVLFNGILRGLKDTFIPMLLNMVSYGMVGIGTAYYLGFVANYGVEGVWSGLALGVTAAFIGLGGRILYDLYRVVPTA